MLKKIGILLPLFFFALSLFFQGHSYGMDTDLYTVTSVDVPPNVLIILDNSSSMLTEDQPPDYNPDRTNPAPVYTGPYPTNAVYNKQGNDWVPLGVNISGIKCTPAQDPLSIDGIWNGKMKSDTTCGGSKYVYLQTGNYLNYLAWATTSNQPRLGLAKGTIHSYVNSTDGIRFGLMVFNGNGQGGLVTAPITDDKNVLFKALSDISASSVVDWTPLAESLYEAMLYFKGGASYYNLGITYNSPTQYYCQRGYVILITDGAPTHDVADDPTSPIRTIIGDYDKDGKEPGPYGDPLLQGSHYMDDVAKYVHENDMSDILKGRQNITVYTIGFNPNPEAIDSSLLQSTATNGGGQYFYAHNSQEFKAALQSIIEEILNKSTSFLAPTVPISQLEKTTSGDRMYLGMFKPTEKSFWMGNIKKFGIATTANAAKGIKVGDIHDKNGNPAIDPDLNAIYDTAVSYWSTSADGGDVERGGVGEILQNMDLSERKIYTYLGTNLNLAHPSNAFTTGNIPASTLGVSQDDEKNSLINYLYGYDAYNERGLGTNAKRGWIFGAVIHSRPLVVHYEGQSVIYSGANDGMLHAFDDVTGAELWAFIPPDLLPNLKNLTGNTVQFFVDGAPKVYIGDDGKIILICGERRGGNHYFALDITYPLNPKWVWDINPGLAYFAEMGQSWSSPLIGKIKYGGSDKWAFFIGGGYDPNQDNLPVTKDDTKGCAIYVVDVLTGSLIWKYSVADNARMKYSIPSDISRVDTNADGRIDRLYVGDIGGQIWRFDVGDSSPTNWTGKCIFDSNDPPPPSGVDRRKIFYPPDVSLEKDVANYELILLGTGDREHPKNMSVIDRLYTVKDMNPSIVLTESNLIDVTTDLLQTGTPGQKQLILNALKASSGWYIMLNQNSGEKCLSPALVFYGISYFSTFTPFSGVVTDPCYVGEGDARLYAVDYLNGNAVFNFDLTNDLSGNLLARSDRSTIIGTAIPSGTVVAVIGGTIASGYIGIGGGIFKAPLKMNKVLVPIYWRQVF